MVALGIDIGTTHGCVGVWYNGKVTIIANDQGFRTTPAYICFEDDEIIVGDTAQNKLHTHAENIVFHLGRLLGKSHEEVAENAHVNEWFFKVEKDSKNEAQTVAVTKRNGEVYKIAAVEFVTLLLRNLKTLAQDYTGLTIDKAVISTSIHCTTEQKQVLAQAAKDAELNVMSYLPDPIAAAIAYGFDDWKPKNYKKANQSTAQLILVVDIGGATTAVTLLNVDKGLFEIVADGGSEFRGGEDLTKIVVDHCAKSFLRKTKVAIQNNRKATIRLSLACEQAKRSLSAQNQVSIEVDSLLEDQDFSMKLSRPRFEELIQDHVRFIFEEIDAVLEKADVDKENVDHVILVGGSCRIPLIQEKIQTYFGDVNMHFHLSPDEVVANGATIEAATLEKLLDEAIPLDSLEQHANVNAVPLSLSVGLAHGNVHTLIHRDVVLPAKMMETFTTWEDNQTEALIEIYEGERAIAEKNTLLAQMCISGITPLPKGEAEIIIELQVSSQGLLTVRAILNGEEKKMLEIHTDQARLADAKKLDHIVEAANAAMDEDDTFLTEIENKLEELKVQTEVKQTVTGDATSYNALPAAELD
uniref:Hsp70like protein putative n=1 Tax=Albugo laibachii Nc14 TaxID=890382 RepID=F0WG94_9STRA|nr:hsp70like protein putative [Albugo laibachii Nc14]|eukprot:CCA20229.1 hsp70like protein putative [Albugo laibachii Nc14]